MDKIEFKPKLSVKIKISYVILTICTIGLILLASVIDEADVRLILLMTALVLFLLLLLSIRAVAIKTIEFTDQITVRRFLSKDKIINYEDVIDVGILFIKTNKHNISLVNYTNANQLVEIFMDKIQQGAVKPKENYHAKHKRELTWAGIASIIAYILYTPIALFIPMDIRIKQLKFVIIFFPLFIVIYFILKWMDQRKQTPATKIIEKADMLQQLEDYDNALKTYDEALVLEPDNARAYEGKADIYFLRERNEEALELYDKVILLQPKLASAHIGKGNVMDSMNRFEEALICYDQAYALNKDLKITHFMKALVLEKMGKLEEALQLINQYIKTAPKLGFVHYQKSILLSKLNKEKEAILALKVAIRLTPEFAEEARTEAGFANIKHELEFRNLIE